MVSTANLGPGRWPRIIALGCLLGLVFVAINLAIMSRFERGRIGAFTLSGEPLKQELTGVIGSQLSAFQAGDFKTAYSYADKAMHQHLASAAFEEMVRTSYPEIAATRVVNYGVIVDNGRLAVVMVMITGSSGKVAHYQYFLRKEGHGWRVSGVMRVQPQGTTA
jgi:hypothetical protein